MSYCALIPFIDGKPSNPIEFRNSWGGAARIWNSLFDAYLKDPNNKYDTWLGENAKRLWPLATRKDLPLFERAVHASTFDLFYVRRDHFKQFANDLWSFVRKYPVAGNCADHLPAWAALIDSSRNKIEAYGFHGTSVAETPWLDYDEEGDVEVYKSLSEGQEVYDWLAEYSEPVNT